MKIIFIATLLIATISAHSWLMTPVPRKLAAYNGAGTCESPNAGPSTTVAIGSPLAVTWTHFHTGGAVVMSVISTDTAKETTSLAAADKIVTYNFNYDDGVSGQSAGNTIKSFGYDANGNQIIKDAGSYVIQWYWSGYFNCADLTVTNPVPKDTNGNDVPSISPGVYKIDNGQYNSIYGTVTCDDGYEASDDNTSCVSSGPNGGTIFGIILLVIVLLVIAGVVGLMVFWKVKRPEKWEALKSKVSRK